MSKPAKHPPPLPQPMDKALRARLLVWRRGIVRAAWLRGIAAFLGLVAGIAVLDFFLPLEWWMRASLMGAALFAAGVVWFRASSPARRTDLREMARLGDELLGDRRRNLLSAYELANSETPGASAFMKERHIAFAQLGFTDLPPEKCRPRQTFRAALVMLVIALAGVGVLALLQPKAVPVILGRLFSPLADIPPYSHLEFIVGPANLETVYGGDLEVGAVIRGGEVNAPVYLLTRRGQEVHRVECFRGGNQRYSQRLEGLVQEVEFAFAVGSARSHWRKVSLLMEPRFALARFRIDSPAYTGEPSREAMLGAEDLRSVQGSSATLSITSNRPLSEGKLTIQPQAAGTSPQTVQGRLTGQHTLEFQWTMLEPADLQVEIRDILGTPSPEPLFLRQRVRPDEKPRLTLSEPGSHVVATPAAVLPVRGTASDDFGLRRIDLVRGMPGYRQRVRTLEDDLGARAFEYQSELRLAELGVIPGDVLELHIEGRDYNPSLTGLETSETARITIISEEEYAQRLQTQIAIEEFVARLEKIREALEAARQAVATAREAAEADDASAESAAEAVSKAEKEIRESAESLDELSRDFPAFEMEKELNRQLAEAATLLQNAADRMAKLPEGASPPSTASSLAEIQEMLNEQQALEEQVAQAKNDYSAAADLLRAAAEFRRLVENQRAVSRWADRVHLSGSSDPDAMSGVRRSQEELRERLSTLPQEILEAADKVKDHPQLGRLAADAKGFAKAVEECGAGESMGSAIEAAENSDSPGTALMAERAKEQLEALLGRECKGDEPGSGMPCEFAALCRGGTPSSAGGLGGTLAGLMQGLSGGGGSNPSANDGYAMPGSFIDLPSYGPVRQRIEVPGMSAGIVGLGSIREGRAKEQVIREENQLLIQPGQDHGSEEAAGAIDPRRIPDKYRGAVRRYFQTNP